MTGDGQGRGTAQRRLLIVGYLALAGASGCAAHEARPAAAAAPGRAASATPAPAASAVTPSDPAPAPRLYETAPRCGPGRTPGPDGSCGPAPAASGSLAGSKPTAAAHAAPERVPGGLAKPGEAEFDRVMTDGDRAYQDGNWSGARQSYARARKLEPKEPAPRVGLLRVSLAESGVPVDYAAAPNDPKIRALLREADATLRMDKEYGPSHVERGRLLLVLGKAEQALSSLERGVELVPNDPEAHSALGVAYLATGKTSEALEHLRRAADLEPSNPERQTNLGTAYMMRGRVDEAIKAYERGAELAPGDARAQGDLGTAYLAQNRPDKALPYLERAVALAPERATFLSNLGYAHQLSGRMDLAIETYKKALAKDDKLGSAWINLGTVLAQKGDYDEAERAFKKALAVDPTDPRVKANLSELAELRKSRAAGKREK